MLVILNNKSVFFMLIILVISFLVLVSVRLFRLVYISVSTGFFHFNGFKVFITVNIVFAIIASIILGFQVVRNSDVIIAKINSIINMLHL